MRFLRTEMKNELRLDRAKSDYEASSSLEAVGAIMCSHPQVVRKGKNTEKNRLAPGKVNGPSDLNLVHKLMV